MKLKIIIEVSSNVMKNFIFMKKTNNTLYTFFIALLMLASGCIQENPDLVNPPLVVETVNARFFNLAQDEQARSL